MIINCRKVTELLTDDAEQALGGYRRAQVHLHLKVCAPCRAYKKQLMATVGILRAMPREAPSEELVTKLLDVAKRTLKD
jgi:hypothetical protein